jgi:hypothetical protein
MFRNNIECHGKKIILNHRHRNKSKSDSDSASHTSGIFRTSAVSIAEVPPRRARLLTWRLVAVGPKNDGKALEHPWEISKSFWKNHRKSKSLSKIMEKNIENPRVYGKSWKNHGKSK